MFIIALFKIAKKALRGLLHVLAATIAASRCFFSACHCWLLIIGAVILAVAIKNIAYV
jgi:hypothetical protein